MIGSTVQKYRIVRELGSGAMGAVYEAVDTLTERPVAMKVLRAELARQPELIERFRSEAVTLARLNHPNIALLYDFFQEGGDYYMAMEFVRGKTLEKVIQQERCLDSNTAGSIMRQTLDGLGHAHSMGVLHRDIKPGNILVTDDMRVKVADFGIARVLGSSRMTRTGRIIGTLEYISPERIQGEEADPRSDLYAAGVVLYEMLTGRLPFTGTTDFELIKAHMEQDPPLIGEILGGTPPEHWDAIVAKSMAKSPADRFQTAEEFSQALIDQGFAARSPRTSGSALLPARPPAATGPLSGAVPAAQALQGAAVAAREAAKKSPVMKVLLAATAVMTLLLIFTIALRIRAANADKTDNNSSTGSGAGVVTVPKTGDTSSATPKGQDTPQVGGGGGNNSGVVVVDPSQVKQKGSGGGAKISPEEQKRQEALDALNGKSKPAPKKGDQRSKALKALDQ
ncbi:MAG: serine/threonine-protein kinase [Candidatus Acidiferrum sp.]|jgi:serine/threonine-protein kinase